MTFDNGESYFIKTHDDIDWTVNSKLIVEIRMRTYKGEPYWDYWFLEQIIKVPETSGDQP